MVVVVLPPPAPSAWPPSGPPPSCRPDAAPPVGVGPPRPAPPVPRLPGGRDPPRKARRTLRNPMAPALPRPPSAPSRAAAAPEPPRAGAGPAAEPTQLAGRGRLGAAAHARGRRDPAGEAPRSHFGGARRPLGTTWARPGLARGARRAGRPEGPGRAGSGWEGLGPRRCGRRERLYSSGEAHGGGGGRAAGTGRSPPVRPLTLLLGTPRRRRSRRRGGCRLWACRPRRTRSSSASWWVAGREARARRRGAGWGGPSSYPEPAGSGAPAPPPRPPLLMAGAGRPQRRLSPAPRPARRGQRRGPPRLPAPGAGAGRSEAPRAPGNASRPLHSSLAVAAAVLPNHLPWVRFICWSFFLSFITRCFAVDNNHVCWSVGRWLSKEEVEKDEGFEVFPKFNLQPTSVEICQSILLGGGWHMDERTFNGTQAISLIFENAVKMV